MSVVLDAPVKVPDHAPAERTPPIEDEQAAAAQIDAALALLEDGKRWQQGSARSLDMPYSYCAAGALYHAGEWGWDPPTKKSYYALVAVVGTPVTVWNDDPIRTWPEVREAFEQAKANLLHEDRISR